MAKASKGTPAVKLTSGFKSTPQKKVSVVKANVKNSGTNPPLLVQKKGNQGAKNGMSAKPC